MRAFKILCSVFVVGLLSVQAAKACTCIPSPPPDVALEQADLVFAGRVLEIREASDGEHPAGLDVTLRVERPFKGFYLETIKVRTARDSASCGFPFKRGERYLVYTHTSEDGMGRVSLCSRTALLEDARDDLLAFDAIELLDEEKKGGGLCGGPSNIAAVQAMLFVFFIVAFRRRRQV